jgi:hypothetical protein
MNVSSSTSIGSQYVSATSTAVTSTDTQKVSHNHHGHHRGGGKAGDSVELSAEAKKKYAESTDELSSDSALAAEVSATEDKALPATAEGIGKPVGGASESAATGEDAKTIQSLLDSLTNEEDTNGDGIVDEKDEQTSTSKAATELKSKLTDWLAGDTTTSVASYKTLVQQLSSLDSSQESAS